MKKWTRTRRRVVAEPGQGCCAKANRAQAWSAGFLRCPGVGLRLASASASVLVMLSASGSIWVLSFSPSNRNCSKVVCTATRSFGEYQPIRTEFGASLPESSRVVSSLVSSAFRFVSMLLMSRLADVVHQMLDLGRLGGQFSIDLLELMEDRRRGVRIGAEVNVENAGDQAFGLQGGAQPHFEYDAASGAFRKDLYTISLPTAPAGASHPLR